MSSEGNSGGSCLFTLSDDINVLEILKLFKSLFVLI